MGAGGAAVFAAAAQLLQRVGARRFQQAVVRQVAADIGDDEGLCHQVGELVGDVRGRGITGDRDRRIEQEFSREDAEVPQGPGFLLRKQVIAPVEGRAQRPVARERRSPAPGEELEPVIQERDDFRRAQHHRVRRGELDRERDAVQPPADRRNRAEVLLVLLEIGSERTRPRDEQLDRGMLQRHVARDPGRWRHAQRRNAVDMLPFDAQRFLAGRQDRGARTALHDQLRKARDRVDEVLAIVDDEENLPVADRTRDGCRRDRFAFQLDAEHARHGRRDQVRIDKRCQFHQHTLGHEFRDHPPGGFHRQRRLADAAGSDEGHHAVG